MVLPSLTAKATSARDDGAEPFMTGRRRRRPDHVRGGRRRSRGRQDRSREVAGRFILRVLLRPEAAGFPPHYELQLFLPTGDDLRLVPQYGSSGRMPSETWAIGQGATGAAWASRSYVRIRGSKVSDGTYGRGHEQERCNDVRVVAAAPVLDASLQPIAVLTASSASDDGFLFAGDGPVRHRELAEVVARVLIDNFGIGGN